MIETGNKLVVVKVKGGRGRAQKRGAGVTIKLQHGEILVDGMVLYVDGGAGYTYVHMLVGGLPRGGNDS